MKEIMVAYWSGTGNTAAMATILGKGIQDGGASISVTARFHLWHSCFSMINRIFVPS